MDRRRRFAHAALDIRQSRVQLADVGHAAVLLAFVLLMWRLAIRQLGRRLID
jgi:hypothetical protein